MKPRLSSPERGDFGLIDLIVMLIAVGAVVLVGYAYMAQHRVSNRNNPAICANDLKQIGLAFRLWAGDNGDKMPAQVSTNAGGTMELVGNGSAFPHFSVMSNELGTPKIIICPYDTKRQAGLSFAALSDANVSYFAVPDADEGIAEMWLAGDRHLVTNVVALKPGLFTMPPNRIMSWVPQVHGAKGNVCLADGSVQLYTSAKLQQSATNALRAYFATTNTSFRLAIP